jgi:hypothetical protein
MDTTQIDGVAAVLFVIGLILLVLGNNFGWALIAIAILKQFWR